MPFLVALASWPDLLDGAFDLFVFVLARVPFWLRCLPGRPRRPPPGMAVHKQQQFLCTAVLCVSIVWLLKIFVACTSQDAVELHARGCV